MTQPAGKSAFIKTEPVIAAHLAAAVVAYVLTSLVTRHVITDVQSSALTQQVLPAVTSALLLILGFLIRRVVSPAARFAEQVEAALQDRLDPNTDGALPPTTMQHSAF